MQRHPTLWFRLMQWIPSRDADLRDARIWVHVFWCSEVVDDFRLKLVSLFCRDCIKGPRSAIPPHTCKGWRGWTGPVSWCSQIPTHFSHVHFFIVLAFRCTCDALRTLQQFYRSSWFFTVQSLKFSDADLLYSRMTVTT